MKISHYLCVTRPILQVSAIFCSILLFGCNGGGGSGGGGGGNTTNTYNPPILNGAMAVSVSDPTTCTNNINIPCVSVTICKPNSTHNASNCVTVNDILVDTGSFGLRVFNQFVSNLNLPNINYNNTTTAECVSYGEGDSNWGPVVSADVQLAADANATNIPIQIINSNFSGNNGNCPNATTSPSDFGGINGILGVGPLVYDGENYFSCSSSGCNSITLPTNSQVVNPIAALQNSSYNNGLSLVLPAISSNGASGIKGTLNLGVGNNVTTQSVGGVYPSTSSSNIPIGMNIVYKSNNLIGFLDSGSNTYNFFDNSIPSQNVDGQLFFTPLSQLSLTTQNQSSSGMITNTINIRNAQTLLNNNNLSYSNIGAPTSQLSASYFDYGLPFFYGKTIYIGFSKMKSNLGTGPYWAF